jgi:hypothetical protein
MQLQFKDCSQCGKRITTTAAACHHCFAPNKPKSVSPTLSVSQSRTNGNRNDDESDSGHDSGSEHSLDYGGYDDHDLQETGSEPRIRKLWRAVAWVLLLILGVSAVFPWFW